ncbi:MAG: hypothetical protein Q9166_006743 [cf. Caloplaca sp. 2 TL-2023]
MAHGPRRLTARAPGGSPGSFNSPILRMNMVSFKALASILPTEEAARHLEDFYMDILVNVRNEWSKQPRSKGLYYNDKGFNFVISALGDTIPWEFVQEIVGRLWTCAARGFTELFDLMYATADNQIVVNISLRLIGAALPLVPGTGSGESSQTGLPGTDHGGTDWREGSVPSVGTGAVVPGNWRLI